MNTVLPYKAAHSIWGQNSTHFSHISFNIHSKLVNLNDCIHAWAKRDRNKMSDVNVHTQNDLCQHLTSQYLGWAMCLHKALCSAASHHQLREYTASQGEIFCEKFHPLHLSSDAPNHTFFKQETAPVSGSPPFCTSRHPLLHIAIIWTCSALVVIAAWDSCGSSHNPFVHAAQLYRTALCSQHLLTFLFLIQGICFHAFLNVSSFWDTITFCYFPRSSVLSGLIFLYSPFLN